jgi:hypothetical protein
MLTLGMTSEPSGMLSLPLSWCGLEDDDDRRTWSSTAQPSGVTVGGASELTLQSDRQEQIPSSGRVVTHVSVTMDAHSGTSIHSTRSSRSRMRRQPPCAWEVQAGLLRQASRRHRGHIIALGHHRPHRSMRHETSREPRTRLPDTLGMGHTQSAEHSLTRGGR